ncbi:MAG: esterase family protein [Fidelibacterota bacterium]|nr:MAG: esterase family protein [Candidatus Neomarinimicrobiota bacterium]
MSLTRTFLFATVIFSVCSSVFSQVSRGVVNEGLTVKSKILKEDVRYTIYLPYDYGTSSRYYPVVYLLHGYTDNDMGWMQFGEAHMIADEAIGHREIPPMILVMPDGGVSFYINNYDNSTRYEDFFIKEFVPYIEKKYRIRSEKRYRGVAGLSMGGFGSLIYALKHPDMFAACAAFSAAVFTEEEIINMDEEIWPIIGRLFGPELEGKARITEHLLSNSPIHLVQNTDIEQIKSTWMYIDCGDDDFLYKGNSTFHIILRDLNVSHEYRVRDGGHQWSYWRSGLADGLKFIGTSFHQP